MRVYRMINMDFEERFIVTASTESRSFSFKGFPWKLYHHHQWYCLRDNYRIAPKCEALRQRYCRGACQISEQLRKAKPESLGFRDFTRSYGKASVRLANRGPDSMTDYLPYCCTQKSVGGALWRTDTAKIFLAMKNQSIPGSAKELINATTDSTRNCNTKPQTSMKAPSLWSSSPSSPSSSWSTLSPSIWSPPIL